MADWNGVPFLRLLRSAERFNERAIFFGSFMVKTLFSRSSALLVFVTCPDHFFLADDLLVVARVARFDVDFFLVAVAIIVFRNNAAIVIPARS